MITRIVLQHPDQYEHSPRSHVLISDSSIPKYAAIHAIAAIMGSIVNPDFYSPVQEILARKPIKVSYRCGEGFEDEGTWVVYRQFRSQNLVLCYTDTEGYLECGTIRLYSTESNERRFCVEFYYGERSNQPLNCSYWARDFEKKVEGEELDKLILNT